MSHCVLPSADTKHVRNDVREEALPLLKHSRNGWLDSITFSANATIRLFINLFGL